MIDSHSHLNDQIFQDNIKEVIQRAKEKGVKKIFVVGYDLDSSLKALKLANSFEDIYAILGIHPIESLKIKKEDLSKLEELLKHPKVIALGEIGLDYFKDKNNQQIQKKFFELQLEINKKYNLPVVLHTRDSLDDVLKIIKNYNFTSIFHSFSFDSEQAQKLIRNENYYFSFNGLLFYRKELEESLKIIPQNKILLETDSPYLHPSSKKEINEPVNLLMILEKISDVLRIEKEYLDKITEKNTLKAFRINS